MRFKKAVLDERLQKKETPEGKLDTAGAQEVTDVVAEEDTQSKAQRALQVVRELHKRYQSQEERWRNYSKLIAFLCFVGLLLAVLYLQRNAQLSYQVHSTIANAVLPDPSTIGSSQDVLNWLQSLLQSTWVDPMCGDGVCETPFEFASYGRFGCRADCGRLIDVEANVTTVQVDITFDFTHPSGSLPETQLMTQATWNVCPDSLAPHGYDCYWPSDQTFTQTSGTQQQIITDFPDGKWDVRVRSDLFNKVSGAVRLRHLVERQARNYTKIYVALQSARANQDFETGVLQDVVKLARTPLADLMLATVQTEVNSTLDDLQVGLRASVITQAQFNSSQAELDTYAANMALNIARRGACAGLSAFNTVGYPSNGSSMGTIVPADVVWQSSIGGGASLLPVTLNPPTGSALTYNSLLPGSVNACSGACLCTKLVDLANSTTTARWESMQTQLIARLDVNVGRLNAQNVEKLALLADVVAHHTELFEFIVTLSTGLDPVNAPDQADLDALVSVYVSGPAAFGVNGQPNAADSLLKRTTILALNVTQDPSAYGVLVERALNRATEIVAIQAEVRQLPEVQRILSWLATSTSGIMAINYTLTSWTGGADAYNYCDLETRAPQYIGVCTPAIPFNRTSVDAAPYACGAFPDGSTLTGDACYNQVDLQFDCAALCECVSVDTAFNVTDPVVNQGCADPGAYCTCDACKLLGDAADDAEYQSIVSAAGGSAAAGRRLQADAEAGAAGAGEPPRSARQLKQLSDSTVSSLLASVNALRSSQDTLTTQVSTLTTQVEQANAAAAARAADTTLQNIIEAGRQDIQTGQARVEALLAEIIGNQNQALAAAQQAQTASNTLNELNNKQATAQSAAQYAEQQQLSAIKQAAQQKLITLAQALALWKRARRDMVSALKTATLSNSPCTQDPFVNQRFPVNSSETLTSNTARERLIGLTNRVVAGMLVHTQRTDYQQCTQSRFSDIENNCIGPVSVAPYGVDPVFKSGSQLFNPDLDNANSVISEYNCSELDPAIVVYNVVDPYSQGSKLVNQPPYCANLFSMRNLPYGFFSFALANRDSGFPVWFDINLSAAEAQFWLTYLMEGLYLDVHTSQLTVELVTYNAELRLFSMTLVRFTFTEGGTIDVTHQLHTIRIELYQDTTDWVRLGLEIIYALCVGTTAVYQLLGIYNAWRESHKLLAYFTSGWLWVGISSTALMVTCISVWWIFVLRYARTFNIDIRYDVYNDLSAQAHILKLLGNGEGLTQGMAAFDNLKFLVQTLSWYYALNGLNILLLIARVLNLMHFQPRLGVVTRSLLLAGPDLLHFSLVAGIVFVGYAMMAHLIFGYNVQKFSSFRYAIDTCFEMLLGDISVNDDLKALTGLQGLAGSLFFWTFELLVFMVLLNFLLAIIVDAFSVVKDTTSESTGLHEELSQIVREKWRAMLGSVLNVHHIPAHRIGALLKQWAGDDDDDDALKNQAGQDDKKFIKVQDHELTEEDLKDILKEAMLQIDGDEDVEDEEKGTGCAAAFKRKMHVKPKLEEEDVEEAVKWILQHFGHGDGEEEGPARADNEDEGAQFTEEALEKERDALAAALQRLAMVQRELAIGQHELMAGQKVLAEQQGKLVEFLSSPFGDEGDEAEDVGPTLTTIAAPQPAVASSSSAVTPAEAAALMDTPSAGPSPTIMAARGSIRFDDFDDEDDEDDEEIRPVTGTRR